MQKIITQEEKERKIKRNQLVIGIVLIGLMVLSSLSFAFINNTTNINEKIEYKGIKFVADGNGYWSFNIQGTDFLTKYNPKETEDISYLNYKNINEYSNKPLYLIGDNGEHFSEISRNLNNIALRINNACLEGDSKCTKNNINFPIKKCSSDNIIIIMNVEGIEKIYNKENCVFIETNYANQVRYADRFLFSILGIQ